VFNDPVTGSPVRDDRSLVKFESRDNESIQVSADLPDGKIEVHQFLDYFCISYFVKPCLYK